MLLGQGVPTVGPYKPGTWAYNDKLTPVRQDVDEARRLLDEAGWKKDKDGLLERDGKPFLTVISLPLTIITLGIFQLVVNSFMLELASYLSVNLLGAGISIASFGSAFMGSILVSIMRSILDSVARN